MIGKPIFGNCFAEKSGSPPAQYQGKGIAASVFEPPLYKCYIIDTCLQLQVTIQLHLLSNLADLTLLVCEKLIERILTWKHFENA